MSTILVCGEALVDVVVGDDMSLSGTLGGGPYNTAIAAGRQGADVGFYSRVSRDRFGERILATLLAAGVDVTAVQRGKEPTSMAMATLADDGAASYTFYLKGTADRLVSVPPELPDAKVFSFGTLSLVTEPGASTYQELAEQARAAGRIVFLDPNVRPAVIKDRGAYRKRIAELAAIADVVKASDDDLEWLARGTHGSGPEDWLKAGAGAIVTTRGAKGLGVQTANFETVVPTPTGVQVVDTIGAGDTIHGSLLAWFEAHELLSSDELRSLDPNGWSEALAYAARAAAITVSRAGANPPWAEELADR